MRLVQVAPIYVPPVMPAMKAFFNGIEQIGPGVFEKINLNGTTYDTAGDFDLANNRWVCSVAGLYLVVIHMMILSVPDGCFCALSVKHNGALTTPYASFQPGGLSDLNMSTSDVKEFGLNDTLELWGYQNSGGDLYLSILSSDYVWLIVHRLS